MYRAFTVSAIAVAAILHVTPNAGAATPPDLFPEKLADYVWIGGGGTGTWQTPGNWTPPAGFAGFPNDPGRDDTNEQQVDPVVGANFSVPLSGNLTVDIIDSDVTVASIKLGATGIARTTDIVSTTDHQLVFQNYEDNDNLTNPGSPGAMPPILPEPIWGFNQGNALIWSTGAQGGGTVNRISADIYIADIVDVEGDRDLHIFGDIIEEIRETPGAEPQRASSITSFLTGGARLYIHGNIDSGMILDEDTEQSGTQERVFQLNSGRGIVLPANPQNPTPTDQLVNRQGIVDFTGKFLGTGWIEVGSGAGTELPLGTVILRGNSMNTIGECDCDNTEEDPDDDPFDSEDPFFDGRLLVARGNLVLANDGALGSGDAKSGAVNQSFGTNFISDNDNRNIPTDIQIAQWHTVRGASDIPGIEEFGDHSIEFSGAVNQSNTRGWVNLLPAGKTLTLSGPQYPIEGGDNADTDRIYTIDGTGRTLITGGVLNRVPTGINPGTGHLRIRGTGTVVVDWDDVQDMIPDPNNPGQMIPDPEDRPSEYDGYTWMEGGHLHFGTNDDLGNGSILSRGGAVGVNSGVIGNSTFLDKLNNSSSPNHSLASPFFQTFNVNSPVFVTYSSGGLMLAADEYDEDLDFASGSLANAANMSLAAHQTGNTYTGTITPSSTVAANPNTYQLGGGGGVLTLPNNNQLTGARNLLATNGGEVRLQGSNNYTGTTRVTGKYLPSLRGAAAANRTGGTTDDDDGDDTYQHTTLTVLNLANGGSPSSIGSSSNAAGNLQIQGSTLKYVGGATSTDRLLTVGTIGATLDASGTGAVAFTNSAALAIDVAESRQGFIAQNVSGNSNNEIFGRAANGVPFSTEDLVVGMRLTNVTGLGSGGFVQGLTIQNVSSVDVVTVGGVENWGGFSTTGGSTISFGPAPQRFLTLTGSNTGNNTLAPLVGNAAEVAAEPAPLPMDPTPAQIALYTTLLEEYLDGYGKVGIRKTGASKWILTGNNTYSGPTEVQAGTLLVNGTQTGNGTTTVSAGATLGGSGALGGALINRGTVAPGTSAGTLTVNGNYQQTSAATLAIEIGGTSAGSYDVLNILQGTDTGPVRGDYNEDGRVDAADYTVWRNNLDAEITLPNSDPLAETTDLVDQEEYEFWKDNYGDANLSFGIATLSGAIDIDLINGFTPTVGDMFTILNAVGINGANVTLTGESSGFNLIVNPTSLVLHYIGGGSGGLAGAPVPEPTSLMLIGIALAAFGCVRRR